MSSAASPYSRPVPAGMLKEVEIQELTQLWHGSDAAAGEQGPWAHKLTGAVGGVEEVPPPASLRHFAEREHRNFLEAAAHRIPGLDGIFLQLLSPPRGDPLPKRSGETLTVKNTSFQQAGMSERRQQYRHHLAQAVHKS